MFQNETDRFYQFLFQNFDLLSNPSFNRFSFFEQVDILHMYIIQLHKWTDYTLNNAEKVSTAILQIRIYIIHT